MKYKKTVIPASFGAWGVSAICGNPENLCNPNNNRYIAFLLGNGVSLMIDNLKIKITS
jgi:hypothetical protein